MLIYFSNMGVTKVIRPSKRSLVNQTTMNSQAITVNYSVDTGQLKLSGKVHGQYDSNQEQETKVEDIVKSVRFQKHAKYFIQMIDKALGMLGPDIELLTEILLDLGAKHVGYGVRPEFFPSMGRSLIDAIQKVKKQV